MPLWFFRLIKVLLIGIFHAYAHLRQQRSIHASSATQVDDHSKVVGGKQHFFTLEGHTTPISIDSGLHCILSVHIPFDHDLQSLPHVVFTSPQEWDPTVLNHRINLKLLPDTDSAPDQSRLQESTFDEYGHLKDSVSMLFNTFTDAPTQACHEQAQQPASID